MTGEEGAYVSGRKSAWRSILAECLRQLGVDDPEAGATRWVAERAEIVAMLRQVCGQYGDNDWDDALHLADVIEKHLWAYLPDDEGGESAGPTGPE